MRRILAFGLAIVLVPVVAAAALGQCQADAYGRRTCPGTAYRQSYQPAHTVYYWAADDTGKVWYHADRAWVLEWVARVNADARAIAARAVADVTPPIPTAPTKQPPAPVVPPTPPPAPPPSDPYGFAGWLNHHRAARGRRPVGHDPGLSAWCSENNRMQMARGMGHHCMGNARRQNVGRGPGSNVWGMWLGEGPGGGHYEALMDPTISAVGIAGSGGFWTFDAY